MLSHRVCFLKSNFRKLWCCMSMKNSLFSLTQRKKWAMEIPISERDSFNEELINSNFERSKKLNLILCFISLALLVVDFSYIQNDLWISVPWYRYLFYTHLFLLVATLMAIAFLKLEGISSQINTRLRLILVILFTCCLLLDCTLTSIIDQRINGAITVYIIGAISIAVMNYFKPLTGLVIFITNYLILVIGITIIQNDPAILRGHYTNGTILAVIAIFLSNILYRTKVRAFLSRKTIERQKNELEKANQQLTSTNLKLQESLVDLDESQNIIFTLALALESKDAYSHGHSDRVTDYALKLAKYLDLSESDQIDIYRAAILHDIGKIGIPDAILNKPDVLTSEEWSIMKSHPERGGIICSKLKFAKEILPVIRHHHERFDGKGYPDNLSGEDIPYLARIINIADAVDAMTSSRPYRAAGTFDQVLEELEICSGKQFDPNLVDAFISLAKSTSYFSRN